MVGPSLPEQRQGRDLVESLALSVLSQVPLVGPFSASAIETALRGRQRAKDEEFLAYLSARVSILEAREGTGTFNPSDDEFVAAAYRVLNASRETADQEKRAILAAALAESGSWSSIPYDLRTKLLDLAISLTPWHLRVLFYFADPSQWLANRGVSISKYTDGYVMGSLGTVLLEELAAGDTDLYLHIQRVVADLEREGLASVPLNTSMSVSGWFAPRTSPLGRDLLSFLASEDI